MMMNVEQWLGEYMARLKTHEISTPAQMIGCTSLEIEAMEREFALSLPSLYRRAFLAFGRSAGELVDRSEFDFYFPEVVELNRRVRTYRNYIGVLPEEPYFVILGRYDEVFQYVCDAAGADDGVVFQLDVGGARSPKAVYPSVSQIFDALLQDHLPDSGYGFSIR